VSCTRQRDAVCNRRLIADSEVGEELSKPRDWDIGIMWRENCVVGPTILSLKVLIHVHDSTVEHKVETPIHDSIRELVTCECKEHGVKS
jgi:hypothetical protein